jgi:hypothetical protein
MNTLEIDCFEITIHHFSFKKKIGHARGYGHGHERSTLSIPRSVKNLEFGQCQSPGVERSQTGSYC